MVRDGKKRKEIMEEDRRHSFQFVRIAFAGRSSDPLRMPSDFLNHISNGLSNRATLKVDSAGRSWNVKVSERSSGGIFIEDGWKQFIKDNSLGNNEILVFTYEGNMCFNIKILEVDGQKRLDAPLISAHQPSASISRKSQGGRTRKKPAASTLKLHPSKSCEDGSGPCESNKPKKFKSGKGSNQSKIEPEDNIAHPAHFQSKDHTARDWKNNKILPRGRRIPSGFLKHISNEVSDRATLKVCSGCSWNTKISKKSNGVFIEDGWPEFLKDNSLGNNEFLVLTYEGNMCFGIQIFEVNGLERLDVPIMRTNRTVNLHPSPKSCEEDVSGNDLPCSKSNKSHSKFKATKGKEIKIELEDQDQPVRFLSKDDTTRDQKKAAESFKSKFPHFKRRVRKYYVHVPKFFSKAHLRREKHEIVLRNPQGKSWVVRVLPTPHAHTIRAGWFAFVADNKLNRDDLCIFEMVDTQEMKVHIFKIGPNKSNSAC